MNNKNYYLQLYNFKCIYNNITIKEIKNIFFCIIFDIYGVKLYKGYVKNGIPNGYGILYKNKKIIYTGNFKNGKIINNELYFDINEKKYKKKDYTYDTNLFNNSIIKDTNTHIYVKQIDIINKDISKFNYIKKKILIFKYDFNKNKAIKKLYNFIKELLKNEINILDLKIIFLFIYNYNINNNINTHNEILIKFIKLNFNEFNIYIKKLKNKIKCEKNDILNNNILNNYILMNDILNNDILINDILINDILNDNLIIIINYINNLCLDYSNNNKIIIKLDNINNELYNYKCKKEYKIFLEPIILKNNININNDDIINTFFIKIKNINNIININKKYNNNFCKSINSISSISSISSNTNSENSNFSNSNKSNNSNIDFDDIYLTAKIKNLFIIKNNDILKYNEFMLSIYKNIMYKNKNKYKKQKKNKSKTKSKIIKSNSCKDIVLLYNNINTLEKIYNINNNNNNNNVNSNTNKLTTFEKNKKIKKEIKQLFKKKINSIKLEIEKNNGNLLDEEWLYYLNIMYKYLPIPIKKRIYTKSISIQTQKISKKRISKKRISKKRISKKRISQKSIEKNIQNDIYTYNKKKNNIKLLKKNLIEKTYL
jgi:hypothetical protein